MKVGTIETLPPEKKKKLRRSGFSGGNTPSSGGNNGGNGGNNGGGNNPQNHDAHEIEEFQPNKSRVLMWFLMIVVLMTFGGLIGAYIVISSKGINDEWKPFALPFQIWVSTALILASSFTYKIAQKAILNNNQPKAKNWLLATTALGGTFISSQFLVWFALYNRGVYVASNPYAGFFYILTAVHAVHVLGGIIALGSVVLRTWQPTANAELLEKRRTYTQVVGWYWHFMDALWIVLVLLLGFWK